MSRIARAFSSLPRIAVLTACGGQAATPTRLPVTPTSAPTEIAAATSAPTEGGAVPAETIAATVEATAAPVAAANTRTIDTPNGPVVVPTNPQRIVTLHPYTFNALLDVGVTPIGTIEVDGATLLPKYVAITKTVETVGGEEVNFEKIGVLKPDLIVGGQVPGVDYGYDKLKQIAPTVLFPMQVPAD